MRSADQIHIVLLQKPADHIRSKRERDTAIVFTPPSNVLVRVGPEQVAQEAGIGDIGGAHDAADLFHRLQVGALGVSALLNDPSFRAGGCLGLEMSSFHTATCTQAPVELAGGGELKIDIRDHRAW